MHAVILDAASLGPDIDLSPIERQVTQLTCHDFTATDEPPND